MKTEAEILPREGKYYGTRVRIRRAGYEWEVKFWNMADGNPSNRELEYHGVTREQWDDNLLMPDGWGGESPTREVMDFCDSHYESQMTYDMAKEYVDFLNGRTED